MSRPRPALRMTYGYQGYGKQWARVAGGGGGGGGAPPATGALLLEDGSYLLLEDGSRLLLE